MRKSMKILLGVMAAVVLGGVAAGPFSISVPAAAQSEDEGPYWASIDSKVARSRSGPDTSYQIVWVYKRQSLPVKVLQRYGVWRQIEDPDGDQGWMHSMLLSRARTAIVTGQVRMLHVEPEANSRVAWRVEPGVVGKIDDCDNGWCRFTVDGKGGWIRADQAWGAGAP